MSNASSICHRRFFTWLLDWLCHNIPTDTRKPCMTHGDYYIYNAMADDKGSITGILDRECADFGAPEQDLAYTQPLVEAQGMEYWQVFLDRYKACGGVEVNETMVQFCQAYGYLRIFLGESRATLNLQRGTNRDIRYVMMELGFTPSIMQMTLANTSHSHEESVNVGQANGHVDGGSNGDSNGDARNGDAANVVVTDNGFELRVFDSSVNIRQPPGPNPNWQNSIILAWWDDSTQIGGFHRLGHEPGKNRITLWNFVTGPEGTYHTCKYNGLRATDLLDDGGFGSGDETCRVAACPDGTHIWTMCDANIEVQLRCTDVGPNIDCYPKQGSSISKGFTSAHFDIPVTVMGKVRLKGKECCITNGLGVRDNGWGDRDWNSVLSHRWVVGTAGAGFFFCVVTWHSSVDEGMASFGWVVRNRRVTHASQIDVVAYMEMDAATNRGGHVSMKLTTGEALEIECTPKESATKGAAFFYPAGVCVVDRLCTFRCGDIQGMCDFETTSNIQHGKRRPATFANAIIDNGFFE